MTGILKVGLDISMNSSGMCLSLDGFKKQYQLTGVQWKDSAITEGVDMISYDRVFAEDGIDLDICKVFSAERLANLIQKIIVEFCKLYKILPQNIRIGFEGTSYGSRGASTADMVIFSSIVKRKMMTMVDKKNIRIFAPGMIKKSFTGNGRANKDVMYESYVKKYGTVAMNKHSKFDDVVDATAITELL